MMTKPGAGSAQDCLERQGHRPYGHARRLERQGWVLPVVGDIAQSDRRVSRGTKWQLGIAKARLGMMLGKVFVRIGHSRADRKVCARYLTRDKRKVLARHGMEQRQEGGLGQRRTHVAKRSLGHIVIEHERGNIRERLDGGRRAIRCGHAVDDLGDTLLEVLHELNVKAAQRAFEHAGIWDDVGRLTTGKLTHGQCDLLGRRHFASDKLLKRQVHMDAGRDGVDADLGARAMAALALQRDAETVHARKRRTPIEHQAERRLAVNMHGKSRLRAWVLQQTVDDGGTGTLKGFLARLEQQLNRGVGVEKLGLAR